MISSSSVFNLRAVNNPVTRSATARSANTTAAQVNLPSSLPSKKLNSSSKSLSSLSVRRRSPNGALSGGVAPKPRRSPPQPLAVSNLKEDSQQDKWAAQCLALEKQYKGLFEHEYRQDIIEFMHEMEVKCMASAELMDMQPELQWYMRPYLIDFLIEIHLQFRLRPETLYLALNIVDRYVSKRVVFKKHYQLVGCSALWIAAKFEDAKDRVPTVQDLAQMCCNAYDESAFIQMEGHVLSTLGWTVGAPSAEAWLRMACMGIHFEDLQTQHCARFIMETTLYHRDFINFPASVLASGSLLLSRFICGRKRRQTEESNETVRVATMLDVVFGERMESLSEILMKKYSWAFYSHASNLVKDFYAKGSRFFHLAPSPVLPANATFEGVQQYNDSVESSMVWSVQSSPGSCADDDDCDMPITPITVCGTGPNIGVTIVGGDENNPYAILNHQQKVNALDFSKAGQNGPLQSKIASERSALQNVDWRANIQPNY